MTPRSDGWEWHPSYCGRCGKRKWAAALGIKQRACGYWLGHRFSKHWRFVG